VSHFKDLGHKIPRFVNPAEFLVDLAAIDSRSQEAEQISISRIRILREAWKQQASPSASKKDLAPAKLGLSSIAISKAPEAQLDTSESELEPGSMEKPLVPLVEHLPVSKKTTCQFQ
jgi:hypothetical protein